MGTRYSQMFIEGAFSEGEGKSRIEIENAATEAVIATVPGGTVADAERAIASARRALHDWSRLPAIERGRLMKKLAAGILTEREHLDCISVAEQGKPLGQAQAEVDPTAMFREYAGEQVRRIQYEILPSDRRDEDLWIRRGPYGVVAALMTWNYPSALTVMNTVVLKWHWYPATVMLTSTDNQLTRDEIFGLVAPFVVIDDYEKAMAVANPTDCGLFVYVFMDDISRLMQTARDLAFGEIHISRGCDKLVKGFHSGWKNSSLGGEDGQQGFEGHLRKKTMYVKWAAA